MGCVSPLECGGSTPLCLPSGAAEWEAPSLPHPIPPKMWATIRAKPWPSVVVRPAGAPENPRQRTHQDRESCPVLACLLKSARSGAMLSGRGQRAHREERRRRGEERRQVAGMARASQRARGSMRNPGSQERNEADRGSRDRGIASCPSTSPMACSCFPGFLIVSSSLLLSSSVPSV